MLKERDEGTRDFVLVDVREPNEYEINQIPGSVLIPKGEFLNGNALAELPGSTPASRSSCTASPACARAETLADGEGRRATPTPCTSAAAWWPGSTRSTPASRRTEPFAYANPPPWGVTTAAVGSWSVRSLLPRPESARAGQRYVGVRRRGGCDPTVTRGRCGASTGCRGSGAWTRHPSGAALGDGPGRGAGRRRPDAAAAHVGGEHRSGARSIAAREAADLRDTHPRPRRRAPPAAERPTATGAERARHPVRRHHDRGRAAGRRS